MAIRVNPSNINTTLLSALNSVRSGSSKNVTITYSYKNVEENLPSTITLQDFKVDVSNAFSQWALLFNQIYTKGRVIKGNLNLKYKEVDTNADIVISLADIDHLEADSANIRLSKNTKWTLGATHLSNPLIATIVHAIGRGLGFTRSTANTPMNTQNTRMDYAFLSSVSYQDKTLIGNGLKNYSNLVKDLLYIYGNINNTTNIVYGCTNPSATNYVIKANRDNGSCEITAPSADPEVHFDPIDNLNVNFPVMMSRSGFGSVTFQGLLSTYFDSDYADLAVDPNAVFTFVFEDDLKGALDAYGNIRLYDRLNNIVLKRGESAAPSLFPSDDNPNLLDQQLHKSSLKATVLRNIKGEADEHFIFWADNSGFKTFSTSSAGLNYNPNGTPIVDCINPELPTGSGGSVSSFTFVNTDIQYTLNQRNEIYIEEDDGNGGIITTTYPGFSTASTAVIGNEFDIWTGYSAYRITGVSTEISSDLNIENFSLGGAGMMTPYCGYLVWLATNLKATLGASQDENGLTLRDAYFAETPQSLKYFSYREIKEEADTTVYSNDAILKFSTFSDNYTISRRGNNLMPLSDNDVQSQVRINPGYYIEDGTVKYDRLALLDFSNNDTIDDLPLAVFIREFGPAFSFVRDTGAGIYTIASNRWDSTDTTFTQTLDNEGNTISTDSLDTKELVTDGAISSHWEFTTEDARLASLPTVRGNRRRLIYSGLEGIGLQEAENTYTDLDGFAFTELTAVSRHDASNGSFLVAYAVKHGFLLMYFDATAHLFVPPHTAEVGIEYHIPGGKWDTTDHQEITDAGGWTPISMAFSPMDNFLYTIIADPEDITITKICIYNTSLVDEGTIRDSATVIENPLDSSLHRVELLPDGNIYFFSIGDTDYFKVHNPDFQDSIDLIKNGWTTRQSYSAPIEFMPIFEPHAEEDGSFAPSFSDYHTTAPDPNSPINLLDSMAPSFIASNYTLSLTTMQAIATDASFELSEYFSPNDYFDLKLSLNNIYTDPSYNKLFTIRGQNIVYRNGEEEPLGFSYDINTFSSTASYAFPSYFGPQYMAVNLNPYHTLQYAIIDFTPTEEVMEDPENLGRGFVTAKGEILETQAMNGIVSIKMYSTELFSHKIITLEANSADGTYTIKTYALDARSVNFKDIEDAENIEDKLTPIYESDPISVPNVFGVGRRSLIEITPEGDKIAFVLAGDSSDYIIIADFDKDTGAVSNMSSLESVIYSLRQILFSSNGDVLYGISSDMSPSSVGYYAPNTERIIKINTSDLSLQVEVGVYPYGEEHEEFNEGILPNDFIVDDNIVYDPNVSFGDQHVPQHLFMREGKIYFTSGIYVEGGDPVLQNHLGRLTSSNNYSYVRYAIESIDIGITNSDLYPITHQDTNTTIRESFTTDEGVGEWLDKIPGCMDPGACNYDAEATMEDGSCIYASDYACNNCINIYGPNQCGECYPGPAASSTALGSLQPVDCFKCGDTNADNYEPGCDVEIDNGFTPPDEMGDGGECIYSDTTCLYTGCMDYRAGNYDPQANVECDGCCTYADGYCVPDVNNPGTLTLANPDDYCGECNDLVNNPIYLKAKVNGVTLCECTNGDGTVGTYGEPLDSNYCDCGTATATPGPGLDDDVYEYTSPTPNPDAAFCDCDGDILNTNLHCDCTGRVPTVSCGCGEVQEDGSIVYSINYTSYCDCDGTTLVAYYLDENNDGYADKFATPEYFCEGEGTGTGYTNGVANGFNLTDTNSAGGSKWTQTQNCSNNEDACGVCYGDFLEYSANGVTFKRNTTTDVLYCACPTEEYPDGVPTNAVGCCGSDVKDCYDNCVAPNSATMASFDANGILGCNACGEAHAAVDDCGVCDGDNSDCACPDDGPEVIKDCQSVCGGTATIDNCTICSGGTTGIVPNSTCTGCMDDTAQNYDSTATVSCGDCCNPYVLTQIEGAAIDNTGTCGATMIEAHLGWEGYDPDVYPLSLIYNQLTTTQDITINGVVTTFNVDNIHFTQKCQDINPYADTENHILNITCPNTNAEIIYTLATDAGTTIATNVTNQVAVGGLNGAYMYKPRYYFRIQSVYEMDTLSVSEIFGANADKCVVKKVTGYQTLTQVYTLSQNINGPQLLDPSHSPTYVSNSHDVYVVEPLWDAASNQYFEFTIDFREVQDPNPCIEWGVDVTETVCCDIISSDSVEDGIPGECQVCDETNAMCAGDGINVPEVQSMCLHSDQPNVLNLYEGPTSTTINGVEYPLVVHDSTECLFYDTDLEGLIIEYFIDTTGLVEEDFAQLRWNIIDSNNKILQQSAIVHPSTGDQVVTVPVNVNTSCALLTPIGLSSKIWRQTQFIVRNTYLGESAILYTINNGIALDYNQQHSPSFLMKLGTANCTFGCDFNNSNVFVSERCVQTVVKDSDGFTDFKIEVYTSGTSGTFEFSSVYIYNLDTGNILARFSDLQKNSKYEKLMKLNKKTSIGIEAINPTQGSIRYKMIAEDGSIVIDKTIK